MDIDAGLIGMLPIALALIAFFTHRWYSRWRLQRVISREMPAQWHSLIARSIPLYSQMHEPEQVRLRQKTQLFLADKTFYGCAGLEVTDEMRVLIAAHASLLVLHHDGPDYPGLASVLVYPSAFVARREEHRDDGTVAMASTGLLGESWDSGRVILAWDAVEKGISDFTDGSNVVLHEFAHQLDALTGATNGAPVLRRNSYRTWARVLSENFHDLQERVEHGQSTVMDEYGATNPAEFFAVATEAFFERPAELRQRRPELYDQLRHYYGFDLASGE